MEKVKIKFDIKHCFIYLLFKQFSWKVIDFFKFDLDYYIYIICWMNHTYYLIILWEKLFKPF
jgi:uncharacterized membrane protein (GlpM family)